MCVCVFVCPVCIKVLGEYKTIETVVYLFICGVYEGSKQSYKLKLACLIKLD